MKPAKIKINSVKQGRDSIIKFIYQDSSTNEYIDVSNYIVSLHLINVTESEDATPVPTSTVIKTYNSNDITDNYFTLNNSGEIIINLPASETEKYIKTGEFELSVITDDATSMDYTLLEGIFEPILSKLIT